MLDLDDNFIKYLYHPVSICLLEVILCHVASTLRVNYNLMFHTIFNSRSH